MCFSFKSSIFAFSIATLSSLLIWLRNTHVDRWNASFIFLFSLTQLFEAGIWKSKNNPKANQMFTKCILFVQWLYPLFNAYMGWQYARYIGSAAEKLLFYLTIMLTFAFIYTTYRIYTAVEGQIHTIQVPINENHNSLSWKDEHMKTGFVTPNIFMQVLWLAGTVLPMYIQPTGGAILVTLASLLVYSYIMFPYTYGSVWCNISVYLGPIMLLCNW